MQVVIGKFTLVDNLIFYSIVGSCRHYPSYIVSCIKLQHFVDKPIICLITKAIYIDIIL